MYGHIHVIWIIHFSIEKTPKKRASRTPLLLDNQQKLYVISKAAETLYAQIHFSTNQRLVWWSKYFSR